MLLVSRSNVSVARRNANVALLFSTVSSGSSQRPSFKQRRTFAASLPKEASLSSLKPYYVTTPIFYVNAAPHIGHLYSGVLADTLARYARLRNPDREVVFCTGTDEHGMKIQRAAADKGVAPEPFCDSVSQTFRDLASAANISHTRFIRTTEPVHYRAVEHLWRELVARGWIYKGHHSGWYSVSDEAFYAANQVMDVHDGDESYKVSKESGSRVEWISEENYKFKLSAFQGKLGQWLEDNPKAIVPSSRWKEVHDALLDISTPLEDLSVSRPSSRLKWGVPVPDDPDHTIYVWVDALANYLTAIGYPQRTVAWPADVQVIGKDIVRFHAIYWPAILMALDLPPPKTLLAHAHWTMDRQKMSKSRGNVADPFEAIRVYGVDSVRYYLMRNAAIIDDSDWSADQIVKHHRRDLTGILGNLLARISSAGILSKLPAMYTYRRTADGTLSISIPNKDPLRFTSHPEFMDALWGGEGGLQSVVLGYKEKMESFEVSKAVESVMELVTEANRLFTQLEPWSKTADEGSILLAHLYAHQALHLAGILLSPVMPIKSAMLLTHLGIAWNDRTWDPPDDSVSAVKFCPTSEDSLLVSSWDGELRLYDVASNASKCHFSHKAAVLSCCWGVDNKSAYSGGLDHWVRSFDLPTEKVLVLGAHTDSITSVLHTSQNSSQTIYTGSLDQTVRLWDPRTPTSNPIAYPQPERVYSMDVGGNMLVVCLAGRLVNIYDVRKMANGGDTPVEPVQTRESSLRYMTKAVACMSNGQGFAMSSVEGRIAVEYYDPSSDIQAKKYAFKCHRQPVNGEDHVWPVNALAFHPTYNTFASGGSDGTVSLWDHTAKKRLKQFTKYSSAVTALSFSPSGQKLAIGVSYAWDEGEDGLKKEMERNNGRVIEIRIRNGLNDESKVRAL
ncbi:methionyl-tRNA synthetase [Tulasnella sp. 331]|nr:methionyl-tRNA synthetase [Tulasnella sp. 331]